jgi:hypothetical protein
MRRSNVTVLKPASRHQAEAASALEDLGGVASEVQMAALATIGLSQELDDTAGNGLAIGNWLFRLAHKLRQIDDKLSPIDMEATKIKLETVMGGWS